MAPLNGPKILILKNVFLLSIFQDQFNVAVNLFDLIDRTPPPLDVLKNEYHAYRMIASRDAALSIYHFKCSLEAIGKQLPSCDFLAAVDRSKVNDAIEHFYRLYPHAEHVRHGIAHAADKFKNPELMKAHGMKEPSCGPGFAVDQGGFLFGSLHERTYSVSNKGMVFSINLDHEGISNLRAIRSAVEEAILAANREKKRKR